MNHASKKLTNKLRWILVAVVFSVLPGATSLANPSSKNPQADLAVHGTISEATALAKRTSEACEEAEKLIIEMQESGSDLRRFSGKKNAELLGRLWQGKYDAIHLQLMGEPIGFDLAAELETSFPVLTSLTLKLSGTPEVQRYQTQAVKKFQKGEAKMNKFLDAALKALDDGKVEAVGKEMLKRGADVHADATFIGIKLQRLYTTRFYTVMSKCDDMLKIKRREQYSKIGEDKAQAEMALVTKFQSEALRVVSEISESGQVALDAEAEVAGSAPIGGPVEAFDYLMTLWGNASAGNARAYAYRTALHQEGYDQAKATTQQLRDNAIESLSGLIQAAARNTPVDQVPTVHPQLLQRVATAQRRMNSPLNELAAACEGPLQELASKDSTYSQQRDRYERAVREPLRWRRMFASKRGEALRAVTPDLTGAMQGTAPQEKIVRPPYQCRTGGQTGVAPSALGLPSHWIMPQTTGIMLGNLYHDQTLLRLAPGVRVAVVPCHANHYVNVALPIPSDAAVDDLLGAVLVSEAHPALSYDASNAVSSAQLHDYKALGGQVKAIYMEGMVTRFITLTNAAHLLTPLGKIPDFGDKSSRSRALCWRFDVQPVWVQNEYFAYGGSVR
ncbi:hypothetical protein N9N28_11170 [Rubripirellula amarantea]|nr:hypothetical protein [Rubripirellula amarantea]